MSAFAHPTTRVGRRWLLLALALVAGLLPLVPLPGDTAGASTDVRDHRFSDPNWYPLRSSALNATTGKWIDMWGDQPPNKDRSAPLSAAVACVATNCQDKHNSPHGVDKWAIDFVADKGDPVHAAGSGILHIGADPEGCEVSGDENDGKWVWIDHGGGLISRYHHLSKVVGYDGKFVTPRTKIGEVGNTGKACDGSEMYLHFQVRRGGISGDPYDPGQMWACDQATAKLVRWPKQLPGGSFDSWNEIEWRAAEGAVPAATNDCIDPPLLTPERLARPGGGPGYEKALVRWGDPKVHDAADPADSIVIARQTWRPSKSSWGDVRYTRLGNPDLRKHLFTGLINGREYRYQVAYHNKVGHGNWSAWKKIKVGTAPDAPTKRRLSTGSQRINFGWYKPDHNGYPVTGYKVAIRRATSSGWTSWTESKQSLAAGSYKVWEGLRRRTTYQVRVRARSDIGAGAWSPKYRATTTS